MRALSERISPSMIVAVIALIVAMSGVGYAATTIGSAQIKNNAVASADIKNGAVASVDLKDGGVAPKDLSAAARTTLAGPRGPQGVAGAAGTPGAPGAPGVVKGQLVVEAGAVGAGSAGVTGATIGSLGAGVYCIDNLPFVPTIAVGVTQIAGGGAGGTFLKAEISNGLSRFITGCPPTTDIDVQIRNAADVGTNADFHLLIN